jgi:glycosyltransferase involved in cell wall biosynthesis
MTSTENRRMRWLLMATHVPEHGGGGGMVRYTVELARGLARHRQVELHVLAQPAGRHFFTTLLGDQERVHVTPALPTAPRSFVERAGLGISAFALHFDVIHGTKHLLPRRCRGIRALTVHDMMLLDRPHDYPVVKRRLLRGPFLRSLRDADVLLCVSAATRDRLCAHLPTARPKAVVVPLAASSALRQVDPEPVSRLEGVPFALVVADPSPRKNLPLVVDCWPDVAARVPGAVLALAGPRSWGVARHSAALEMLTAAGRVDAMGFLTDGELRWCYEHARVVLCPSLLEGYGLPAAEALAFGAPLITSDDPALCEVSGDRATHLSGRDPAAWARVVADMLVQPRSAGTGDRVRTWVDVAEETVQAIQVVEAVQRGT